MSNPNVSWDIQDQNDRIISILAWVVVVVLVLYACVYFYKQARGVAAAPGATDSRLARSNPVAPAPANARTDRAVTPLGPPSTHELAVADSTNIVSHRPVNRPSPTFSNPNAFPELEPMVAASTPAQSTLGYALRIGKPHPTQQEAQKELFRLKVVVQDINFVQDNGAWVVQVGKYKTLAEAKADVKKIQSPGMPVEIIALDAPPKFAAEPELVAERPAARPSAKSLAAADPRPARGKVAAAAAVADPAEEVVEEPLAKPKKTKKPAAELARGVAEKRGKSRADSPKTERGGKVAKAADEGVETADAEATETPATPSSEDDLALAPDVRSLTRGKTRGAGEEAGERAVLGGVAAGEDEPVRSRKRKTATVEEEASEEEVDAAPRPRKNLPETEEVEEPARPKTAKALSRELSAAAADAPARGNYSLQVGAFSTEEKARAVAGQLRSNGLSARVDEAVTGESTVYRVRVGSYEDSKEAQSAKRRVSGELGFRDVRVIRD